MTRPDEAPKQNDWDPQAQEPAEREPRDPQRGRLAPESARQRQNEGGKESGGGAGRPEGAG